MKLPGQLRPTFVPDPHGYFYRVVNVSEPGVLPNGMSYVDLEPHAVVEEHSHPHEQLGMLLAGRAIFYIGDEQKTVGPGDMWCIPGGVRHRVVALDEPVKALDVFCPVREEYR